MREQILTDYKKEKKILVSPLNQAVNFDLHPWEDDILPELIWIALLTYYNGHNQNIIKIIDVIAKFAKENLNNKKLATCSDFLLLNDKEKFVLISYIDDNAKIIFNDSFSDFINYFPDFPLSFLTNRKRKDNILDIKQMMYSLLDKYSVFSTQVMSVYTYLLYTQEKLFFSSKVKAPNLNSINDYPNTEESKITASSIRNITFITASKNENDNYWCDLFWKRSCNIDECE